MNSYNRLSTASPEEQTAAFNVVYWDLVALVKQLPDLVQGQAMAQLNSPVGRARILKVLGDAYDAAEKVRQQRHALVRDQLRDS